MDGGYTDSLFVDKISQPQVLMIDVNELSNQTVWYAFWYCLFLH